MNGRPFVFVTPQLRGFDLSRTRHSISDLPLQFWLLVIFFILSFFMGGSSRADVQSVAILRPISVVFCGMALLTLKPEHIRTHWVVVTGVGITIFVLFLYALPIPQNLLMRMPSHQIAGEIRMAANIGSDWGVANIVPVNGWNAVTSICVPLAVILLGIQLSKDDLMRTLPLLVGLGAISGLFGFFQVISSSDSPFYLYQITNDGAAVGLFANRNHAAVLLALLIPMLAVYGTANLTGADKNKTRLIGAFAMFFILIPLILVTGSRSGFLIAILGLGGAALLFSYPSNSHSQITTSFLSARRMVSVAVLAVVGGLVFVTIFFSRATAVERLFGGSAKSDLRQDFWISSLDLWNKFMPLGSGPGSFAEVYRVIEPLPLLDATYLNRAHNDWVETMVVLGIPGMLLLGVGVVFYLMRARVLFLHMDGNRRTVIVSRLAAVLLAMLAFASFVDYPLRTPTLMSVFALLLLWFGLADKDIKARSTPRLSPAVN